ncbi:hypothetical protein BJ742DRAFT_817192 [Cladochytrium replicatum]|nr:hypothetical protein BJ742DRAFT_817192 [Cladochytrium replicatum]
MLVKFTAKCTDLLFIFGMMIRCVQTQINTQIRIVTFKFSPTRCFLNPLDQNRARLQKRYLDKDKRCNQAALSSWKSRAISACRRFLCAWLFSLAEALFALCLIIGFRAIPSLFRR